MECQFKNETMPQVDLAMYCLSKYHEKVMNYKQ